MDALFLLFIVAGIIVLIFYAEYRRQDNNFIIRQLHSINRKLKKIMGKQEQFEAVLGRIDTATTDIAEDLRKLRDEIAGAGLPSDVEDSILARMTAHADRLEGIGADPENPVPPTEPTEHLQRPLFNQFRVSGANTAEPIGHSQRSRQGRTK